MVSPVNPSSSVGVRGEERVGIFCGAFGLLRHLLNLPLSDVAVAMAPKVMVLLEGEPQLPLPPLSMPGVPTAWTPIIVAVAPLSWPPRDMPAAESGPTDPTSKLLLRVPPRGRRLLLAPPKAVPNCCGEGRSRSVGTIACNDAEEPMSVGSDDKAETSSIPVLVAVATLPGGVGGIGHLDRLRKRFRVSPGVWSTAGGNKRTAGSPPPVAPLLCLASSACWRIGGGALPLPAS